MSTELDGARSESVRQAVGDAGAVAGNDDIEIPEWLTQSDIAQSTTHQMARLAPQNPAKPLADGNPQQISKTELEIRESLVGCIHHVGTKFSRGGLASCAAREVTLKFHFNK